MMSGMKSVFAKQPNYLRGMVNESSSVFFAVFSATGRLNVCGGNWRREWNLRTVS
jgi:hypothetical protein